METIINKAEFLISAVKPSQYPQDNIPEFAFCGKSNVGKSSLINKLVGRKKLVKVSGKPGKTRLINFFNVDDEIRFVDLPGYGYAEVSKSEKDKWGIMIEDYLQTRDNLVNAILVVDSRHKPTENDKLMYDYIRFHNRRCIIVATKVDKLKSKQKKENIDIIKKKLDVDENDICVYFSSQTGEGREELWEILRNRI